MRLANHLGETFEIRVLDNITNSIGEKVDWWYQSSIVISECGKKRKTNLKFLTNEDLELLVCWLKAIYAGNFKKTNFQFVDSHVWVRVWKKGKEPFLRFFIQGDAYRKFIWDWRLNADIDKKLLKYIEVLEPINCDFSLKLLKSNKYK